MNFADMDSIADLFGIGGDEQDLGAVAIDVHERQHAPRRIMSFR